MGELQYLGWQPMVAALGFRATSLPAQQYFQNHYEPNNFYTFLLLLLLLIPPTPTRIVYDLILGWI